MWHIHKMEHSSGDKLPTTLTWMSLKTKSFREREASHKEDTQYDTIHIQFKNRKLKTLSLRDPDVDDKNDVKKK